MREEKGDGTSEELKVRRGVREGRVREEYPVDTSKRGTRTGPIEKNRKSRVEKKKKSLSGRVSVKRPEIVGEINKSLSMV